MPAESIPSHLLPWIEACLGQSVPISSAHPIKNKPEREVWDCSISGGTDGIVLTIFNAAAPERVNASLPFAETTRKCAAAFTELPEHGIPSPRFLGLAIGERAAAIAVERLSRVEWTAHSRCESACILARLHRLDLSALSPQLRDLIVRSDPRMERTRLDVAERLSVLDNLNSAWRAQYPELLKLSDDFQRLTPPVLTRTCLVHGDYFASNLLATDAGVNVLDWETLGLGDPMWDLSFLIGAERGVDKQDSDAVIESYAGTAPVDLPALNWHSRRWSLSHCFRDLMKSMGHRK